MSRSCWWIGVVLFGCTSLNDQDFKRVHCEIWNQSAKDQHALSFSYRSITNKQLPVVSTGKAASEMFVKDVDLYVRELESICSVDKEQDVES